MTALGVWLATAGGAGYAPFASGTFGAAVGVAIYVLTRGLPAPVQVAIVLAVSTVGVWASAVAARHFAREDPGQVVIDEVAGQLASYLLLNLSWTGMLIGFLAFRVFDIVKPWPAGKLESLHGGWGIMADDLMAGVYAWMATAAIVTLFPALR